MRLLGRNHLESRSRLERILARPTQRLSPAAIEAEIGKFDDRLLAQLEQRQSEIDVDRQVSRAYFVKHRPPAVLVGALAEPPRQLALFALRSEWITQGDPAAPGDAVHDHAAPGVAEKERLVAEEGEIRDRVI